jgi:hypothetical protein
MSRHHNNGLPHKEQEQASQKGQHQYQHAEQKQACPKNAIDERLPVETGKKLVSGNVFGYKIEGYPNHQCRQHTEHIGDDDEKHARDKPPDILNEKLIEIRQILHINPRATEKPKVKF